MMRVNLYPITILSKYSIISFKEQTDGQRYGLIQVSSFSGMRWYATAGLYGATKVYNKVFGNLIYSNLCA